MFSHMRVLRFGLKTHIFYSNTQPNVCILSHIWSKVLSFFFLFLGISPPIFKVRSFHSRVYKGYEAKSRISFYWRMGTLFLPSDRQYTLRGVTSYHLSFAYSLVVECNSLITLSLLSQFICGHHPQVSTRH